MKNEKHPSAMLTLSEAARLLGVSRPKMTRMVSKGQLVAQTDPLDERAKLVRRSDVLALLERSQKAA
jgi:excisionase family DNA binding protein